MCEATPESIAAVIREMVVGEMTALAEVEGLTRAGLIYLRARLADTTALDCPHARLLLLSVIERLAPLRGMAPEDDDLWARVVGVVPDSPEGIDGAPPW